MRQSIRGGAKNDRLSGTHRDDDIDGGRGDDLLIGGGGNDVIHGGPGFDIAQFSGSFLDYAISGNRHAARVADLRRHSPDGADRLFDVEALRFSDRTIYLDGRNNAPYAVPDSFKTREDERLSIDVRALLRNDGDFDRDRIALASLTAPAHGTLVLHRDELVYTPAPDYNGPDGFTYTIADSRGARATASVTLEVKAVNDAPVAAADQAQTNEDRAIRIDVLANDTDADTGDALAVRKVDAKSARGAALRLNDDGTITYDPGASKALQLLNAGQQVDDTFRYVVADEHGATRTATVTVRLTGVNDINGVAHDGYIVGATVFADADGDRQRDPTEFWAVTDGGGRFSIGGPLAQLVLTGGVDAATALPFAGQLTAPAGYSVVSPLTSVVVSLARTGLPVGTADNVLLGALGLASTIDLGTFDPLAQAVGGSSAGAAAFVESTAVENVVAMTAAFASGRNGTSVAAEAVRVFDALAAAIRNLAPGATIDLSDVATLSGIVSAAMPNPTPAAVTGVASIIAAANAAADQQAGTGTALLANVSAVARVAQGAAADALHDAGSGAATIASVVAAYTGANLGAAIADAARGLGDVDGPNVQNAPIARDDAFAVNEDQTLAIEPASLLRNDVDYDGQALTPTIVSGPTSGTLTLAGGTYRYTPNADFSGSDSFTYRAGDGALASNPATARITVAPVADRPSAVADSISTLEDTPVRIGAAALLANDTDPDAGDTKTIVSVGSGVAGSVALAGGFVTFTPAANFFGDASFVYTMRDSAGLTSSATVSVTVVRANDAPTARADTFLATEDTIASISTASLLANDTDPDAGDALTVVAVGGASHGRVVLSGGFARFTPDADYSGTAGFTYVVRDSAGEQSTGAVTLIVSPVNDAPVNTLPASLSAREDTAVAVSGIRVEDVDSANVEVLISPDHGTVSITRNSGITITEGGSSNAVVMRFNGSLESVNAALATVVYRPRANYNGPERILLNTNDLSVPGGGRTDTDSLRFTVEAVNDLPVAQNDLRSMGQRSELRARTVLINDSDVDGDDLTAVLVEAPTDGGLTLNPDGTFTYTPLADFVGNDSFLYRAQDGTGTSNLARVVVTVTPLDAVNHAPLIARGDGIAVTTNAAQGGGVVLQDDGRILVRESTVSRQGVARFRVDGTVDPTFSDDGVVNTPLLGNRQNGDLLVQADGKIVVGGSIAGTLTGPADFFLQRYDSNGTLDTTFGGPGGVRTAVGAAEDLLFSLARTPDGKIVAVGQTDRGVAVVRYNANGSLDTTFSDDGKITTGLEERGKSVAVQPDGKIVIGGQLINPALGLSFGVMRLNVDGTLDTTFNSTGRVTTLFGIAESVLVQPDGKIVAAGTSVDISNGHNFHLVRYLSDGSLDTTFGDGDGRVVMSTGGNADELYSMALQADGRIVVAGNIYDGVRYDFVVMRFTADGVLDASFDGDGRKFVPMNNPLGLDDNSVVVQADGKIVIAGGLDLAMRDPVTDVVSANTGITLLRLNPDGSADHTFGAPVYVTNGAPVALDDAIRISDPDLARFGHYEGASLTLARHGGPDASDVFSEISPVVSALVEGGNLVVSNQNIGTVARNSAGTLHLEFNSNATQATIDLLVRALAYSNDAGGPPRAVQIDWRFSDGNSGGQGAGGVLDAATATVVGVVAEEGQRPDLTRGLEISGGAGSDLIIGGPAVDRLTGGAGVDRFAFSTVNDGPDTITDFQPGGGGDVLDLSTVLVGYDRNVSVPSRYVRLTAGSDSTTVWVNAAGTGEDFVALAVLAGRTNLVLGNLLNDGNLVLI